MALLGPPGRSYRETRERNAAAVRAELGPDDRARALSQHTELMSAIEAGRGLPASLTIQAQWLREVLDVDPAVLMAALADARRPRVALARLRGQGPGGRRGRRRAAPRGGGPLGGAVRGDVTFFDLDHLFKREEGEVSTPASYRETRPVDPVAPRVPGGLGEDPGRAMMGATSSAPHAELPAKTSETVQMERLGDGPTSAPTSASMASMSRLGCTSLDRHARCRRSPRGKNSVEARSG